MKAVTVIFGLNVIAGKYENDCKMYSPVFLKLCLI